MIDASYVDASYLSYPHNG